MTRTLIILLILSGCRTGDNSPQPSCIYQCQNVLVQQPAQPVSEPTQKRRK